MIVRALFVSMLNRVPVRRRKNRISSTGVHPISMDSESLNLRPSNLHFISRYSLAALFFFFVFSFVPWSRTAIKPNVSIRPLACLLTSLIRSFACSAQLASLPRSTELTRLLACSPTHFRACESLGGCSCCVFRCILASLQEGLFVPPSLPSSVCPHVRRYVRCHKGRNR